MPINNANLFNAALSGAAAGIASRAITDTSSGSYAGQSALINSFAVAFDALIAPIVGGGSRGQSDVVEAICSALFADRIIPAEANFAGIAAPLVALFTSLSPFIQPDSSASSITPVNNIYVVDPNGTAGDGSFSGNKVFKTVAAAVAAVPNNSALLIASSSAEAPVSWTDKRLTFFGFSLDESSAHSIQLPELRPSTSGPSMGVELNGVSAVVNPGNSVVVTFQNSSIDAIGNSGSNYLGSGSPDTCAFSNSTGGLAVSGLNARSIAVGVCTINGTLTANACNVLGDITLGVGASTIAQSNLNGHAVTYPVTTTLNIDVQTLRTAGTLTRCAVNIIDSQPLQNGKLVYWDAATVVPTTHQNGTQNAPFKQLSDAVAVAQANVTDTVILAVGFGDAAQNGGTFDGAGVNNTFELIALNGPNSRQPVRFGDITLQNHCHVTMYGIQWNNVIGTNSRLWARCCISGFTQMQAGNVRFSAFQAATPSDTSTPWTIGNVDCSNGGTFAAFGMKIAGNITIGGGTATTENCIQQCDMAGGPGFSLFVGNAATTVAIDRFSLARARAQNFNVQGVNNLGITNILDFPLTKGQVFVVGALAAGAIQDVAVAFAGARPNDTFSFAPNPAAMLANVTPIAVWCNAAGNITARFLATAGGTAGGNYQLDINVNANSGN
jgi:hypothetical protein